MSSSLSLLILPSPCLLRDDRFGRRSWSGCGFVFELSDTILERADFARRRLVGHDGRNGWMG